jgi:hypothetical protein
MVNNASHPVDDDECQEKQITHPRAKNKRKNPAHRNYFVRFSKALPRTTTKYLYTIVLIIITYIDSDNLKKYERKLPYTDVAILLGLSIKIHEAFSLMF